MRFVYRDQRNGRLRGELHKARVLQTLRRNIKQVELPRQGTRHDRTLLRRGKRGVQIRRLNASILQTAHLIAHQRYQRAYDQRKAAHNNARYLIAHRLAGAGRHDRKRIATCQQSLHHALLARPEILVAEMHLQRQARLLYRYRHGKPFPNNKFHNAQNANANLNADAMQTQMRDYMITSPQSCKLIAACNSFGDRPEASHPVKRYDKRLDDNAVYVIYFMLDDLRGKATEALLAGFERFILIRHANLAIPLTRPLPHKRQAPLLSGILA